MELDDLYQEIILDHYRHPRHAATLTAEEVLVDEENPLCGDRIRLTAAVRDGVVTDLRFDARGCAISVASSSLMAEALVGRPLPEVRARIGEFIGVMRGEVPADPDRLGDLAALDGVRRFPLRVKCATMCWHAAGKALDRLTPA